MKNILTIVFLVTFVSNVFAIISTPYSNSIDNTGTVKYQDKAFIMVRAGETLLKGDCVYYDTSADNGITVKKVPVLSGQSYFPACIVSEAIASGKDGKCQVYGYNDSILFDAATTAEAGEAIYCGSAVTAGQAIAIASASVAAYNRPVGQFFDASAASGSVEGFVNFL